MDGIQMWTQQRQEQIDGPLMGFEMSDLVEPEEDAKIEECGAYLDDIKGLELQPELARKARLEELEVFMERGVYEVVPRSSMSRGFKFIGIRWVETDKGVPGKPKVRSRLVCQEFAFAPKPPLVATRWLLSELASQGRHGPGDQRLMVLDVKRAFVYTPIVNVSFMLPEEDESKQSGDVVGLLRKAFYGTQDAPVLWQRQV